MESHGVWGGLLATTQSQKGEKKEAKKAKKSPKKKKKKRGRKTHPPTSVIFHFPWNFFGH